MAGTYTPVAFNEGAPLDPQKLMELQSNITSLVGDVNSLKNTTVDASYTMLTDGGTFQTPDLVVGKAYTYEVPYSAAFDESSPPRIISSVGSELNGEMITLSVSFSSTKPTIQVWTNKARKGISVNWMAFQKK